MIQLNLFYKRLNLDSFVLEINLNSLIFVNDSKIYFTKIVSILTLKYEENVSFKHKIDLLILH